MDKRVRRAAFGYALLVAFLGALLIGCSAEVRTERTHAEESELARARAAYTQAAADPAVSSHAPGALAEAQRALQQAETATDLGEQAHLAYVAQRRAEIARAQARQRLAEQEIETLMRQRAARTGAQAPAAETRAAAPSDAQSEALRAHTQAQEARDAALAAQLAGQQAAPATTPISPELQRLETDLAALEVKAEETPRGLVLTLADDAFRDDGVQPAPTMAAKLDPLITFLRSRPERQVLVEGHTDDQAPLAESLRLSQARAESVRALLVAGGIGGYRIQARGYGPDFPVASNETPKGQARNRRVELIVVSGNEAEPQP